MVSRLSLGVKDLRKPLRDERLSEVVILLRTSSSDEEPDSCVEEPATFMILEDDEGRSHRGWRKAGVAVETSSLCSSPRLWRPRTRDRRPYPPLIHHQPAGVQRPTLQNSLAGHLFSTAVGQTYVGALIEEVKIYNLSNVSSIDITSHYRPTHDNDHDL